MASALAGPWRRRGGDHAAALGGVALQGRLQRATKGGGLASGRLVGASVMQNVAGQALHCAGDGSAQRQRGKIEEGAGGGRKDHFAISENSRV